MPSKNNIKAKEQLHLLLEQGERDSEAVEGDVERLEFRKYYAAIRHVIKWAYETDSTELQSWFDEHLPGNTALASFESANLRFLRSGNAATRSNAISRVLKVVCAEWGMFQQLSCLHPKTPKAIVSALRAETSVENARHLMEICGQLYRRGFEWSEFYLAIESFFEAKDSKLRDTAVAVTRNMPFEERRWKFLMPLLVSCRNKNVLGAFHSHCKNAPDSIRNDALKVMFEKYECMKNARRIVVGGICALVQTIDSAKQLDLLADWSDRELLSEIEFWMELETNELLDDLVTPKLQAL